MTTVTYTTEGPLALITIDRPKVLNALNAETLASLDEMFAKAAHDRNIHGVLLTGSGDVSFVAGADINELARIETPEDGEKVALRGQSVFNRIEDMTKPVLAAVGGFALGGGLELAMACHERLIAENALLGQPEVNLGLIPGYGGTQRLPRRVGYEQAFAMLRTGKPIKADFAASLGLGRPALKEGFLDTAKRYLLQMIDQGWARIDSSPLDLPENLPEVEIGHLSARIDEILKNALREGLTMDLEEGLKIEAKYFGLCRSTEDMAIGLKNFLTNGPKSKAVFLHR